MSQQDLNLWKWEILINYYRIFLTRYSSPKGNWLIFWRARIGQKLKFCSQARRYIEGSYLEIFFSWIIIVAFIIDSIIVVDSQMVYQPVLKSLKSPHSLTDPSRETPREVLQTGAEIHNNLVLLFNSASRQNSLSWVRFRFYSSFYWARNANMAYLFILARLAYIFFFTPPWVSGQWS